MAKELTVDDLRAALEGVPGHLKVKLSSDTGVDQGVGTIIVESARRVNYKTQRDEVDYFDIYVNDVDNEDENGEED